MKFTLLLQRLFFISLTFHSGKSSLVGGPGNVGSYVDAGQHTASGAYSQDGDDLDDMTYECEKTLPADNTKDCTCSQIADDGKCPAGAFYERKLQMGVFGPLSGFSTGPCWLCPAGYFSSGCSETCTLCPPAKHASGQGLHSCAKCPRGRYHTDSSKYGAHAPHNAGCSPTNDFCSCRNECPVSTPIYDYDLNYCVEEPECEAGQYDMSFGYLDYFRRCEDCPAGYFQKHNLAQPECFACPEGYDTKGQTKSSSCSFDHCPPGKAGDVTTGCVDCASGKYTSTQNEKTCKDCPSGKATDGKIGQTACSACPAGKVIHDATKTCIECNLGSFINQEEGTCEQCPAGKASQLVIAGCKLACGTDRCEDGGYYHGLKAVICHAPPGTELPQPDDNDDESCSRCGLGNCQTWRGGGLLESAEVQYRCSFPKEEITKYECTECDAGKFSDGTGIVCQSCAAGKFSDVAGASSSTTCKDCAVGYHTNGVTGSKTCTECLPGYFTTTKGTSKCTRCLLGRFAANSQTPCEDCPVGYHSDTTYSFTPKTKCDPCPWNKIAPNVATVNCERCPLGKLAAQGNTVCKDKQCTCSGGTGATGEKCPIDGMEFCDECNDDYRKNGDKCDYYPKCTCENGEGAEGTHDGCLTHGQEKCLRCDPGYYLRNDGCHACPANSDQINYKHPYDSCTCKTGYSWLQGATAAEDTCSKNNCNCANGLQADICVREDIDTCKSCNEGYRIVESTVTISKQYDGYSVSTPYTARNCEVNVCSCSHGSAKYGGDCLHHNTESCFACEEGYELDEDKCVAKEPPPTSSTCNNGNPTPGYGSTENHCSSCWSDSYLRNAECLRCPAHSEQTASYFTGGQCECVEGYHREDPTDPTSYCVINECTCPGGQGVKTGVNGNVCAQHGAIDCLRKANGDIYCKYGYMSVNDRCELYQCYCNHGVPKDGNDQNNQDAMCYEDQDEACKRCDANYWLGSPPFGLCIPCPTNAESPAGNEDTQITSIAECTCKDGTTRETTAEWPYYVCKADVVVTVMTVTYDVLLDNTYELCESDNSKQIKVLKEGKEHNVYEVGNDQPIYASLDTVDIEDTNRLLAAAPGQAREFYCSAHKEQRFTVYCRENDVEQSCPHGYNDINSMCVMSDARLLQNMCGDNKDIFKNAFKMKTVVSTC